jgi:hypothetical protein
VKRPSMDEVKDVLLSVIQAIDLKRPVDLLQPGPRSLSDDSSAGLPSTGSEDQGSAPGTSTPCEDQRPGEQEASRRAITLLSPLAPVRKSSARARTTSQLVQADDDEPSHTSPRFASASASDSPRNADVQHNPTTLSPGVHSPPSSPRLVIDI